MFKKRWSVIGLSQISMSILLGLGAPSQFEAGRPNLGFLMFGTSFGSPAIVLAIEGRKYRRAERIASLLNESGLVVPPAEVFGLEFTERDEDMFRLVSEDQSLQGDPKLAIEVIRQLSKKRT